MDQFRRLVSLGEIKPIVIETHPQQARAYQSANINTIIIGTNVPALVVLHALSVDCESLYCLKMFEFVFEINALLRKNDGRANMHGIEVA